VHKVSEPQAAESLAEISGFAHGGYVGEANPDKLTYVLPLALGDMTEQQVKELLHGVDPNDDVANPPDKTVKQTQRKKKS
jgi:hypothetical protein